MVVAGLSAAAALGYLSYRLVTSGPAESPAASSADAVLADDLPEFSLNDLAGEPTSIRQWSGRPMLINFWATWCAPCLREIPLLKSFHDEQPSIQVVGIAVDRLEPVLEFAEEVDFNYPVLVGEAEAMNAAAAFGVKVFALPFTVFASAEGAILGIRTGEIHPEHLENLAAVVADLEAKRIDLEAARARIAGFM